MKYIKLYEDINWDDWDEYEEDPDIKFQVGDKVQFKGNPYSIPQYFTSIPNVKHGSTIIHSDREAHMKDI